MEFDQHKPIYLQIADAICERILTGQWPEGDRIPSVRECGVSLEVNPNTVARSYDELSSAREPGTSSARNSARGSSPAT